MMKLAGVLLVCILAPIVLGRFKGVVFDVALFTFVFPRTIYEFNPTPPDVFGDLSTPNFTLTSYTIAIAMAIVILAFSGARPRIPRAFVVAILGILVLMVYAWVPDGQTWSGVVALFTGIGAWAVGAVVGNRLLQDIDFTRYVTRFFAFIIIFELAIEILELLRVHLPEKLTSTGRVGLSDADRVFGTIGHPANLSKIIFMLVIVLIVLAASSDKTTRRWSYAGIFFAIPSVGMTVSRANTVALLILLVLWVIVASRGVGNTLRTVIVLGVTAALGVFFNQFESRIISDPTGGARPELLSAGIEQLWRTPYIGTGPNRYIDVVSKFSADTALGYPVHNVFLFTACSIGIPLALVILWPHLQLVHTSMRERRQSPAAMVVLMAAPGMLIIMLTGWAMMSTFLIVTWFFVAGVMHSQITSHECTGDEKHDGHLALWPIQALREQRESAVR